MQVIKPRSFQGLTEEKQQCEGGVVVLIEGFHYSCFSAIVTQTKVLISENKKTTLFFKVPPQKAK